MSIRQDYILRQIEKMVQLVAALAFKKTDSKLEIIVDQALAELTGLDASLFSDPNNARFLDSLLSLLSDDNQKALTKRLLELKDQKVYGPICHSLMAQIDRHRLHAKVKELLDEKTDT